MQQRYLLSVLVSLTIYTSCTSQPEKVEETEVIENEPITIRTELKKYFDSCQVEGSIVIYDEQRKQWIVSDTVGVNTATLPASTFKIINLLIALETKVITDENEVVKWVGTTDTVKYGYRPEIYHDMTVREAFEVSAGWVFVELAKKIGKVQYEKYLSLCQYGNGDLSQTDADFWNFGAFGITPVNQVAFLRKVYTGEVPFSKRNLDILKSVMVTEQADEYTIRAKTGWTRDHNMNTGWWVGYLEKDSRVYFFATRLLQDRKFNKASFGSCRKEITKAVFKQLEIIK